MNEAPPIPENYLQTVCKQGQGALCCIFAAFDTSSKTFTCEKHSALREQILKRQRSGTMVSNSVNCTGAPNFTPCEELPCQHCGMTTEHIATQRDDGIVHCVICGTEQMP